MEQSRTANRELESKLAGFVRSYIDAFQSGEHSEAEERLRWVCTGLEFLLGNLLHPCDEWHGCMDGITPATDMLPDAVNVNSQVDLTVRGRADWLEEPKHCCIEPFCASLQIAERADALVGYEICFANAGLGLGKFPYGKNIRRVEWYFPNDWLFIFSMGTLEARPIVNVPR